MENLISQEQERPGLKEDDPLLLQYKQEVKQKKIRIKQLESERTKAREQRLELEREIRNLRAALDKKTAALKAALRERSEFQKEADGFRQEALQWQQIFAKRGLPQDDDGESDGDDSRSRGRSHSRGTCPCRSPSACLLRISSPPPAAATLARAHHAE